MLQKEKEQYIKFLSDKERPDVMIEGSLILHVKKTKDIIPFIFENKDKFSFYISESLFNVIKSGKKDEFKIIINYYGFQNVNIENIINNSINLLGKLRNLLHIFKITSLDLKELLTDKRYKEFYNNLMKIEKSDIVRKIIFEEWVFIQKNSAISSAYKKVFNTFKRCGTIVIEYSKKSWEKIAENLDRHVRKEFSDIPENNIITNTLRLRFLGKWIGRNWPELLILNQNLIFPALGLRVIMKFILIDP